MVDVPGLLRALGIDARQEGHKWRARCPNPKHDDHDPSWEIVDQPGNPEHGSHHCFSCDAGGGPAGLVWLVLGISIAAAEEWIAANVSSDETAPTEVEVVVGKLARQIRLPEGLSETPFKDWPAPPRRYAESRGLTAAEVERWEIRYATSGRLAGRIVFPIRDGTGRLLSYTGRSFVGLGPRYLTPRASENPEPGAIFGQRHWGESGEVVVTEGPLDALACLRAGAVNVAALCGSQLAREQVLALSAFKRVLVATDPDDAGNRVAEEVRASLARWAKVGRVKLPTGSDPAKLPTSWLGGFIEEARA